MGQIRTMRYVYLNGSMCHITSVELRDAEGFQFFRVVAPVPLVEPTRRTPPDLCAVMVLRFDAVARLVALWAVAAVACHGVDRVEGEWSAARVASVSTSATLSTHKLWQALPCLACHHTC